MKKVKIMLASTAILSVLGGALAFKANYIVPICYVSYTTDAVGLPTCVDAFGITLTCTTKVTATTTTSPIWPLGCTTIPNANGSCVKPCPILTRTMPG